MADLLDLSAAQGRAWAMGERTDAEEAKQVLDRRLEIDGANEDDPVAVLLSAMPDDPSADLAGDAEDALANRISGAAFVSLSWLDLAEGRRQRLFLDQRTTSQMIAATSAANAPLWAVASRQLADRSRLSGAQAIELRALGARQHSEAVREITASLSRRGGTAYAIAAWRRYERNAVGTVEEVLRRQDWDRDRLRERQTLEAGLVRGSLETGRRYRRIFAAVLAAVGVGLAALGLSFLLAGPDAVLALRVWMLRDLVTGTVLVGVGLLGLLATAALLPARPTEVEEAAGGEARAALEDRLVAAARRPTLIGVWLWPVGAIALLGSAASAGPLFSAADQRRAPRLRAASCC
jgi:hypothetical protein